MKKRAEQKVMNDNHDSVGRFAVFRNNPQSNIVEIKKIESIEMNNPLNKNIDENRFEVFFVYKELIANNSINLEEKKLSVSEFNFRYILI